MMNNSSKVLTNKALFTLDERTLVPGRAPAQNSVVFRQGYSKYPITIECPSTGMSTGPEFWYEDSGKKGVFT